MNSSFKEKIRNYEFWEKICEAVKLLVECFYKKIPTNYDSAIEHLLDFLKDLGIIKGKTSGAI